MTSNRHSTSLAAVCTVHGTVTTASDRKPVKLLGDGELKASVKVRVDAISAQARGKVEAAGGSVELLGAPSEPQARGGKRAAGKPKAGATKSTKKGTGENRV